MPASAGNGRAAVDGTTDRFGAMSGCRRHVLPTPRDNARASKQLIDKELHSLGDARCSSVRRPDSGDLSTYPRPIRCANASRPEVGDAAGRRRLRRQVVRHSRRAPCRHSSSPTQRHVEQPIDLPIRYRPTAWLRHVSIHGAAGQPIRFGQVAVTADGTPLGRAGGLNRRERAGLGLRSGGRTATTRNHPSARDVQRPGPSATCSGPDRRCCPPGARAGATGAPAANPARASV